MNNRITINVGVEKNKVGGDISPVERFKALNDFNKRIAIMCGGYTSNQCEGGYVMNDGDLVVERSVQYTIMCSDEDLFHVKREVEILRDALEQESILWTVDQPQQVEFV